MNVLKRRTLKAASAQRSITRKILRCVRGARLIFRDTEDTEQPMAATKSKRLKAIHRRERSIIPKTRWPAPRGYGRSLEIAEKNAEEKTAACERKRKREAKVKQGAGRKRKHPIPASCFLLHLATVVKYTGANYTSPQCHITCPKNLVVSRLIRQGSYTDLLSLTRKIPSGETRTRFI